MIKNRNLWIAKMTDSSSEADKSIQLPYVDATANAPTAATTLDGSLYFDRQTDKLYCCKAGAWKEVTVAS